MVNYYGDCIELYSLSGNTSANSVIRAMKRQFAHHGISDELITDKGLSEKLRRCLQQQGVRCFQVGDYAKISLSTTKRRCRPG